MSGALSRARCPGESPEAPVRRAVGEPSTDFGQGEPWWNAGSPASSPRGRGGGGVVGGKIASCVALLRAEPLGRASCRCPGRCERARDKTGGMTPPVSRETGVTQPQPAQHSSPQARRQDRPCRFTYGSLRITQQRYRPIVTLIRTVRSHKLSSRHNAPRTPPVSQAPSVSCHQGLGNVFVRHCPLLGHG